MELKKLIGQLDATTSQIALKVFGENDGLSCFLFHAIKEDNKFVSSLYPQENLSISLFEKFVVSLLESGYIFVGPDEIQNGSLLPGKKYGLITFDDGYFNNTWCLEILEKYKVPAIFFITTSWIQENEKLWGDIIFYQRFKRGISFKTIHNEIKTLIPKRISFIKDYITKEFGVNSFNPSDDQDRPMTSKELHDFSKNPWVHIGNHTHNHEALKYLSSEEIRQEVEICQTTLKNILGYIPGTMAFPYGRFSKQAVKELKNLDFNLGFTTIQKKTHLPISDDSFFTLSRFNPIVNNNSFNFNLLKSPVQLKTALIEILHSNHRV